MSTIAVSEPGIGKLTAELFEEQARARPDQAALLDAARRVSYAELNARANRLSQWLRARGLTADDVVMLHLDRGCDLVIAALAAIKAGIAYLPVDPANPVDRVDVMVADAGASLVLCGQEHLVKLRTVAVEAVCVAALDLTGQSDADPGLVPNPADLAYVVYTSGSTGTPKGVMISHGALAHLVTRITSAYRMNHTDTSGLVCSPSFDVSAYEIWAPLSAGARIDIPPHDALLDPRQTVRWLAERRITLTVLPTPLAERALRVPWPGSMALRLLLTGGDRLHVWPDPALPFRLINNYGPTENTVISTLGVVPDHGAVTTLPTIGAPLPGNLVEILDDQLRAVPPGEVGEIYLGGPQLSRGYLGRPDLTADRFVPCPRSDMPGARLYRSGDLGRWLPQGEIEFVGRVDDQVKLRGHRIELGEITAVLTAHPAVSDAYVMVQRGDEAGDARLVGYVVPTDLRRLPATSELRAHLGARVPGFMVPSVFVILEALPYNTNGKVDRRVLPRPELGGAAADYVAPRTDTQQRIAAVWAEVLGVKRVGLRDSFFDLGGHSLLATAITGRLAEAFGIDVPIREIFRRPVLGEFAESVDDLRATTGSVALPPLLPGAGSRESPLSMAQQQVWFIEKLAPGTTAYHSQATIRVNGAFDSAVFERVLTEIVRRHESLRTTYEERAGGGWQVVRDPAPYPLQHADLSRFDHDDRERRLAEFVLEQMRQPFDLAEWPLSRWSVVRLGPQEHELVLVEHHFVHDGWSFSVLMAEVEALYNAFATGAPSPLPEPTVQYRDYVAWQREMLSSPAVDRQLAYWRARLAGAGVLSLPTDRPRPKVQSFAGAVLRLEVPAALPAAIREICRREGVSLYITLYAAFVALLHRYTGDTDICVASGFASRRVRETEGLIGMLVNPVVLRSQIDGRGSFRQLLAHARDVVLEAAAHQETPFPLVVQSLGLERDPSRNPLSQVMFSAHDSAVRNPQFAGATGTVFEMSNGTAKVDLNIIVVPRAKYHLGEREHTDDRITVLWEYNTDLFDAATMHTMSSAFFLLLAEAVARPETPVSRLPVLDDRQAHETLVEWNPGVGRGLPKPATLVDTQVERWARSTPDALAVAAGAERLTYGELYDRATALAARLSALAVTPEEIVGICLPAGVDLPVAELAVLRTGAAFLPIDPTNPDERIDALLRASGSRTLITSAAIRTRLRSTAATLVIEDVDASPARSLRAELRRTPDESRQDDLAYVIYTSGSTGQPKGVLIQQHAFANLVAWHRERFALTPADRTTSLASPGFDFSLWEMWPTLTAGGSVHLPARATVLSPPELRRWLSEEQITVTLLPTPLAEALLARPWPDPGVLRCVHAGGDRLSMRPDRSLGFEMFNSYGPTENTMISTTGVLAPAGTDPSLPHIGKPIAGTAAYLLDRELNLVAPGATGEIYLGGAGLARGYLGQPDLTADRFVPDPFGTQPGARLYRTGDLARHLADGSISFLGRSDEQVQLRGHRIEPAEITAMLRTHSCVRDAFTGTYLDEVTHATALVGYVVPVDATAAPTAAELRALLSRVLPAYMVPGAYVVLPELPLTRNGKLDRRALPAPAPVSGDATAPPGTADERRLAEIWRQVLALETVGVHDNFFDLGGHSLLLSQVHRRLVDDTGRAVPLVKLYEYPTISALAGYLTSAAADDQKDMDDLGDRRRAALKKLRRGRSAK